MQLVMELYVGTGNEDYRSVCVGEEEVDAGSETGLITLQRLWTGSIVIDDITCNGTCGNTVRCNRAVELHVPVS